MAMAKAHSVVSERTSERGLHQTRWSRLLSDDDATRAVVEYSSVVVS